MMLVEIQTALWLGKRRGGMRVNKIFFLFTFFFFFYFLISGCVLLNSKHKTKICHGLLVMGSSKVSH